MTLPVLSHLNPLTTISITSLLFLAPHYSWGDGGLGCLLLAQGHTAELEFELRCLAPELEPSMTKLCDLPGAGGTERHLWLTSPKPQDVCQRCRQMTKGLDPTLTRRPPGSYTEPVEGAFQAVLAAGCPCELLASRLVSCHLLTTLSSLQGFLPPAPIWEPRSKHLHFVQGRPWLSA